MKNLVFIWKINAIYAINHFIKINKNNYIKVRDHCHYTGQYRGAAHKIYNLMYNTPREIHYNIWKMR